MLYFIVVKYVDKKTAAAALSAQNTKRVLPLAAILKFGVIFFANT